MAHGGDFQLHALSSRRDRVEYIRLHVSCTTVASPEPPQNARRVDGVVAEIEV